MPDGIAEQLAAPLEELIAALGAGIGRSQAALDRHAIEIQRLIDADPALAPLGIAATWYQIPSSDLEIRVSLALERAAADTTERPRIWAAPVNARYANKFAFAIEASSTVKLTVVAIPPPAVPAGPRMTAAEAIEAAGPHLVPEDSGFAGRVSANYDPARGTWTVIQVRDTAAGPERLALVRIDDATGKVIGAET